ncbi:MAG: helix-turn-helix domain-containing protein, partial [Prevotella sp.]|nr:helix-turn-helix domain-containing protein [Prevotella sp.]
MADLTNTQKKEWARTLYLRENLTQQEIADRVGVSRVTVSHWCRGGKWEEQKVGLTLTRREQVQSLYRQVAEVNNAIQLKPEGQRYPDAKQADTIVKLTS